MVIVTKMTNGTLQTVRQVKPNGLSIMSQPLHMWKHIEHKHKGEMNMKKVMMDAIYDAIDEAKTLKQLLKVEGMLEMFFICVNTQGITLDDYHELCYARSEKTRKILNKEK